jgi:hypothetical protein
MERVGIGKRRTETLRHVVFQCDSCIVARRNPLILQAFRDRDDRVYCLNRAEWTWSELRALLTIFADILSIRDRAMAFGRRGNDSKNAEEALELWGHAVG